MDSQNTLRTRIAGSSAPRFGGSAVLRSAIAVCLIAIALASAPKAAGAQLELPPAPTRFGMSFIIEPELTGPAAYWDPCWPGGGSGESTCAFMQATGSHTAPLNCAVWDFGPRAGDLAIRVFVPKRNATATVTYELEHWDAATGEVVRPTFDLRQAELYGWTTVYLTSNASLLKMTTCNNSAREGIGTHDWIDRLIGVDVVEVTCWSSCDTDPKSALWTQGWLDQFGPERADVLVMSFGGNDIGFSHLFADTGYSERLDNLLDPELRCSGLRYEKDEPGRYKCDLQIDGNIRGGIDDFYVHVVNKALTDTGQLYIVGYPSLIAPYDDWPTGWFGKQCTIATLFLNEKEKKDLAKALVRIADRFNSVLMKAVGRANAELGEVRVHYLDLFKLYRTGHHQTITYTSEYGRDSRTHPERDYSTGGSHEYCGKGDTDTWIMGVWRGSRFHSNDMAYSTTASALADLIADTHPYIDQAEKYKSYFE